MLTMREESILSSEIIKSSSTVTWFFLSFEFLLGLGISACLLLLTFVKTLLPKPPRDLTGDVVLVAGATSKIGNSLAEEFARNGCLVICVDENAQEVEKTASRLCQRYPGVESTGASYRKQTADDQEQQHHEDQRSTSMRCRSLAYACNLCDRQQIQELAKRVRDEVGYLDTLVTCAESSEREIFDAVSNTLMSHYWTVLAFLPSMLLQEKARVIGITPTASINDAYEGSKAALAGLMGCLGEQFTGRNNGLTFMTVAPKAEPSLLKQSESDIAKEIVQAVQRDSSSIFMGKLSNFLYVVSCRLYGGITLITKWLEA
ncbi:hypothetical protein TKK_0007867 [Trichogramma kaykai]|uniref:Uncharacterized protein n=1 Tax=Trichogramma kaykai TaxID=54128 RepID=A0ABD2X6T9_9HYME